MCDHENREQAMEVIAPGIWCDPCLVPLITALNNGGIKTVASCCGHHHYPGWIILDDDSQLILMSREQADEHSAWWHDRNGCKPGQGGPHCPKAGKLGCDFCQTRFSEEQLLPALTDEQLRNEGADQVKTPQT